LKACRRVGRLNLPQGEHPVASLTEAPHDYFRWTRYAIEGIAQRSGLQVVERLPCGGSKEVLADVALKMLLKFSRKAAALADTLTRPLLSTEGAKDGPFTLGNIAVLTKD
jgi:hypothetical protein